MTSDLELVGAVFRKLSANIDDSSDLLDVEELDELVAKGLLAVGCSDSDDLNDGGSNLQEGSPGGISRRDSNLQEGSRRVPRAMASLRQHIEDCDGIIATDFTDWWDENLGHAEILFDELVAEIRAERQGEEMMREGRSRDDARDIETVAPFDEGITEYLGTGEGDLIQEAPGPEPELESKPASKGRGGRNAEHSSRRYYAERERMDAGGLVQGGEGEGEEKQGGQGADRYRKQLAVMEQAHECHVAELQRRHEKSLEETRGHAKLLVEEEVARALSESQVSSDSNQNLRNLNQSVEAPARDFLSPGAQRELKAVWDTVADENENENENENVVSKLNGTKLDDAALRRVFDQVGPICA